MKALTILILSQTISDVNREKFGKNLILNVVRIRTWAQSTLALAHCSAMSRMQKNHPTKREVILPGDTPPNGRPIVLARQVQPCGIYPLGSDSVCGSDSRWAD
jgi:hypothetical protein